MIDFGSSVRRAQSAPAVALAQVLVRYRSSRYIAAIADANFGSKGAQEIM
jgi:hypothetical protein